MRKIKLIILITILFMPYKIYALNGSLAINCNDNGLYQDRATTCTITGSTDEIITGLDVTFNLGEDIEVSSFQLSSEWASVFTVGTVTDGTKINAVAEADNNFDLVGDFTLATFNVALKEGATSSNQEISLSSIAFMDAAVHSVSISGEVIWEFEDFITMDQYQKDTNKMIIYGLAPMTVGVFKSNVSTNAILSVLDNQNNALADTNSLATGQTFRVSFLNNNTSYKISILGDVLGDGQVTKNDAKRIALHIIDGNVITGDEYLMAADYDGNNVIKMNDVVHLMKSMEN